MQPLQRQLIHMNRQRAPGREQKMLGHVRDRAGGKQQRGGFTHDAPNRQHHAGENAWHGGRQHDLPV